jgi:hypothetical protein
MLKKEMSSLWQVMETLRERGFIHDFKLAGGGKMLCGDDHKQYTTDDLYIEKVYRFEGDSDPGDMSVLYALHTYSGKKGLYVDGYGASSSNEGPEFMKFIRKVKIKREESHSLLEPIKRFFKHLFGQTQVA